MKNQHNVSIIFYLSKSIALFSKLFRQWGLGTIYAQFENISYFKDAKCLITKFEDVCLEIRAFDSYWAPYFIGDRVYEADVKKTLEKLTSLDAAFIDCGANIGYWSAIASSKKFGWKYVVAIEANPSTFEQLQRNARLNNDRFKCHFGAIFNSSGQKVFVEEANKHAVAHIGNQGIEVNTITIDDVVTINKVPKNKVMIIKLDVEGAEIAAIEGSKEVQKLDHVFIYEDWMIKDFPVTHYLLENNYRIYGVSKDSNCVSLKNIEDVKQFQIDNFKKHGIHRQYGPLNSIACKEGKVLDLMEAWARACSIQSFHRI